MKKIGHIASIWHYPVKGMAGSSLAEARVDERGIKGDRLWAVRDLQRQEIQSCKFRPQLLQCRASYTDADMTTVTITLPSGEQVRCDDHKANDLISALVGHQSELRPLEPAANESFYRRYKDGDQHWLDELKATFAREPGEPLPDLDNLPPEMKTFVSQLGTFFLVAPLHILTTASLKEMHSLNPAADWHLERFRPNIFIETDPEITGLAEQAWLGHDLRIGDTTIHCHDTAPRCGAVVRKQQKLEEDRSVLRSIVAEADQNLGIYGNTATAGAIRVGDAVYLA